MTTSPPRGPLSDVVVVELAGIGPAPFAALLLAELGADVVRIERPGGVSPLGDVGGLSRSRPNVAVDVKSPAGRDVVLRLVEGADVLIEGFRPGVAERLGLGPQDCHARNERLIYGRMTGWGQTGPLAPTAGHDINYAALSGALHLCGTPERPLAPVNVVADFGGGTLYLVMGILAALHERTATGRGQVIDAAMVDGAASLVTMMYGMLANGSWEDRRGVNMIDGGLPCYGTYQCADGKWVAVGALEPQFWAELNAKLGVSFDLPQLDPAGFATQRAAYEAAFGSRTRDEWAEHFAGSDACVTPVLSMTEAPEHPHNLARGIFARLDGGAAPRIAPRFSGGELPDPTAARVVGADTVSYLARHGFTAAEIDDLLRAGTIRQAPEPEPKE
ncbi:MAG: CaiB/BaiF CoA-transferase family protein [Tetrasphaera sp.]